MSAASVRAGRAFVEIELRRSAFLKGINQVERTFAKKIQSIQKAGLALTGIGFAGLAGFTATVKSASDLAEAVNKTQSVFGPASKAIETFAKTSADKFGLSKRAANDYASELGLILTKTGSTRAEAAKMSIDLVKLAADMASMNNIGIDEALTKLKAGLVGSSEPLRSVGVLLSAAAVEARAAEMGLEKVGGKFTEGAKVAARYALILEQTKETQGDFTKTSTSLANATRRIGASMENAASSIGGAILPVYERLAGGVAVVVGWFEKFVENNKLLTQVLFGATGAITLAGVALLGLSTAGSVALAALGAVGSVVSVVTAPMFLYGSAIAAVVAGLTALVAIPVAGFFAVMITQSKSAQSLLRSLGDSLGALLTIGKQTFSGLMNAISSGDWSLAGQIALKGLEAGFLTGMAAVQNNWKTWLVLLGSSFQQTFKSIMAFASSALTFFAGKLVGVKKIASQLASGNLSGALATGTAIAATKFSGNLNLGDMLFGDLDARAKAAQDELKRLVALAAKAAKGDPIPVPIPGGAADKANITTSSKFNFKQKDFDDLVAMFSAAFRAPPAVEQIERQRSDFSESSSGGGGSSKSTFVGAAAGQLGLAGGGIMAAQKQTNRKLEKLATLQAESNKTNSSLLDQMAQAVKAVTGWDIGTI